MITYPWHGTFGSIWKLHLGDYTKKGDIGYTTATNAYPHPQPRIKTLNLHLIAPWSSEMNESKNGRDSFFKAYNCAVCA